MKHFFFTALLLCVLVASLGAAEPQVNETGKAFAKAFQANDIEAIMALYAPDAEMFPPDSMVAKGHSEIRKSYADLFNGHTIQSFSFIEAKYETVGDISFARGLFRMTMVPKAGGAPVSVEGRFSDVSRRINGKWLYVVDHASVPFAPPSETQTQTHHH